jgi:lipopolysaccharide/colanic/teichoic acid biosynthesis glycosyltransferase
MVIATTVLTILSPIWLLIALAIKLTSEGPALFKAPVVGRDGVVFTYYKFRTMVPGDDSHHRDWLRQFVMEDRPYSEEDGVAVFKALRDPRVTPIGGLLRRTSLDEVPQLINVVRGEMSIVGPRPPVPAEYEHYDARARTRLAVLPGITGLYQVSARSRVPFSEMLAIDRDYIERRSVAMDLSIIARTAAAMLRGSG